MRDEIGVPKVVDRSTFQGELDALRVREKAHTREGDAIAAARRRLPMVEMDPAVRLTGPHGTVDASRRVRGPQTVDCLLLHVVPWQTGTETVRGVHLGYLASARTVLYSFSRRHFRGILPRSVRRERSVS